MIKLDPDVREVTLSKLQPNQKYELELLSVSTNSMLTNSSSIVNFISPSNGKFLLFFLFNFANFDTH